MTLESFRNYCLAKKGVEETYPMSGDCVWMKVKGKMFALANVTDIKMNDQMVPPFHFVNLKCSPEEAIQLREQHPSIEGGWHQSKKHWNTVYIDGSLDDSFITELIDKSYDMVVSSLSRKLQNELND